MSIIISATVPIDNVKNFLNNITYSNTCVKEL